MNPFSKLFNCVKIIFVSFCLSLKTKNIKILWKIYKHFTIFLLTILSLKINKIVKNNYSTCTIHTYYEHIMWKFQIFLQLECIQNVNQKSCLLHQNFSMFHCLFLCFYIVWFWNVYIIFKIYLSLNISRQIGELIKIY